MHTTRNMHTRGTRPFCAQEIYTPMHTTCLLHTSNIHKKMRFSSPKMALPPLRMELRKFWSPTKCLIFQKKGGQTIVKKTEVLFFGPLGDFWSFFFRTGQAHFRTVRFVLHKFRTGLFKGFPCEKSALVQIVCNHHTIHSQVVGDQKFILAQLAERLPSKRSVAGSRPDGGISHPLLFVD